MSPSLQDTIIKLRSLIKDPNAERMNPGTMIGYLGELLVLQKLTREKILCEQMGNQKNYDIACPDLGPRGIRIDVKTSKMKEEHISYTGKKMWGWALDQKRTKAHTKAKRKAPKKKTKEVNKTSHIVCVQLDEKLVPLNYYVISHQDLHTFPSSIGQFKKSVKRTFIILNRKKEKKYKNVKLKTGEINDLLAKCEALAKNKKIVRRVSPSQELVKTLLAE